MSFLRVIALLAGSMFAVVSLSAADVESPALWPTCPATGLTVSGKVVEVYDGDTCTVEITHRVRVRAMDCWCAEVKTKDEAEKRAGLEAKQFATKLALGKPCKLHVPASHIRTLGDVTTMGRVLGWVYVAGDEQSLSERMVKAGHATRFKGGNNATEDDVE